jgi:hypothetical protein
VARDSAGGQQWGFHRNCRAAERSEVSQLSTGDDPQGQILFARGILDGHWRSDFAATNGADSERPLAQTARKTRQIFVNNPHHKAVPRPLNQFCSVIPGMSIDKGKTNGRAFNI